MNAPIHNFEMNCETRREREFLVAVSYRLSGDTVELLSAHPCHADIPLTAYEWQQIEAEANVHASEVLSECLSLENARECRDVRRAA